MLGVSASLDGTRTTSIMSCIFTSQLLPIDPNQATLRSPIEAVQTTIAILHDVATAFPCGSVGAARNRAVQIVQAPIGSNSHSGRSVTRCAAGLVGAAASCHDAAG